MQWAQGLGMRRPDPSQPPYKLSSESNTSNQKLGPGDDQVAVPLGPRGSKSGRTEIGQVGHPYLSLSPATTPKHTGLLGCSDGEEQREGGLMPNGSPRTVTDRPQPHPSRITIPTAGSPICRRWVPWSELPPKLKPVIY